MKITKKHLMLTNLLTSTIIFSQSAFASSSPSAPSASGGNFRIGFENVKDGGRPTNKVKTKDASGNEKTLEGINEIAREYERLKNAGQLMEQADEKKLLKTIANNVESFSLDVQNIKIGDKTLRQLKNENPNKTNRDAIIDGASIGSEEVFGKFLKQRAKDDEALDRLTNKFDFAKSLRKHNTDASNTATLNAIDTIERPGGSETRQIGSDLTTDGPQKRARKAQYQKLVDINGISGPNKKAKLHLLRDEIDAIRSGSSDSADRLANLRDNIDLFFNKNPENTDVENLDNAQKPDRDAPSAIANNFSAISNVHDERISDVSSASDFASSGVSAGDMFSSYGMWVKGTVSSSTQKPYGFVTGYKSEQAGITIGADTGDESMIGVSYSFFDNKVKNKSDSSKKDDIKSHTGTVYGKYVLSDNVFMNGQFQFGMSEIKKRRMDATGGELSAKPKATTFGGKVELGYNYMMSDGHSTYMSDAMSNLRFIPTIGLSHFDTKVKGYTESGPADALPVSIGKSTAKRTSLISKLSIEYPMMANSVMMTPEVHANFDYGFNTKNSGTSVSVIEGIDPIVTPSEKQEKFKYGFGASLKMMPSDMYEFSASYDLGLAKKFMSHTGSVKIRVNF